MHANQSATLFSGKTQNIINFPIHDYFHSTTIKANECEICQSLANETCVHTFEVFRKGNWYELSLSPITYSSQTNTMLHISRNITLQKDAQVQLEIVDRMYNVLRLTNKAIISSKNKQDLLNAVCKIAVKHGGFAMAWIGMIENKQVIPVSSAGDTAHYLNDIEVRVDNSVFAKGPVGIAANYQKVAYVNNIETDDSFLPWREAAQKHGYRSLAAIPVIQNDICIGVFAIYSSLFDAFDKQVLELLSSLSNDISSITTYIRAEEKRSVAEAKLRPLSQAIEQSKNATIITNLEGIIEYINPYFSELLGYQESEIINKNISIFPRPPISEKEYQECWKTVISGKEWHGEIKNLKKDGRSFWALLSVSPILSKEGDIAQIVWTSKDNTELHKANETIKQLAYFDALTNLPNRRLFQDRCKQAISAAQRHQSKLALLYFDLDNFKHINDSWGHDFGDSLLIHVANTLLSCVRDMDTVTRLGGDEFAVLITEVNDAENIAKITHNILAQLNKKNRIEQRLLSVSTSIGIKKRFKELKAIFSFFFCMVHRHVGTFHQLVNV